MARKRRAGGFRSVFQLNSGARSTGRGGTFKMNQPGGTFMAGRPAGGGIGAANTVQAALSGLGGPMSPIGGGPPPVPVPIGLAPPVAPPAGPTFPEQEASKGYDPGNPPTVGTWPSYFPPSLTEILSKPRTKYHIPQ